MCVSYLSFSQFLFVIDVTESGLQALLTQLAPELKALDTHSSVCGTFTLMQSQNDFQEIGSFSTLNARPDLTSLTRSMFFEVKSKTSDVSTDFPLF